MIVGTLGRRGVGLDLPDLSRLRALQQATCACALTAQRANRSGSRVSFEVAPQPVIGYVEPPLRCPEAACAVAMSVRASILSP